MRRVAPRRSPVARCRYAVSLKVDTQADGGEQKVEVVSTRAVLNNLWLTALNQLQPTYVQVPGRQAVLASRLLAWIKAGTLNIWPYFHHETRA
jgi:hypothetical protein